MEVLLYIRNVHDIVELADLAGGDGLRGVCVHDGGRHVTGGVIHNLQGDTALIGTGRNGDVEYERSVTQLDVATEVVINGAAT